MKQSNKVALRRLVLSELISYLRKNYDVNPAEQLGNLSPTDLDALLAFRSDAHLEELRFALDRIDNDRFGICLRCQTNIPTVLLSADPTRRLCSSCEMDLNRSMHERYESILSPPAVVAKR
jgi:RNA polymerase-binding transcription factor DksA